MIVIYMITNLVNGKVYIGSTGNINDRFRHHKSELNNSIHHNEHLQNAWNKYGSDSSSIDVFKLIDWFIIEYPDEDLEISMEVLDNALL